VGWVQTTPTTRTKKRNAPLPLGHHAGGCAVEAGWLDTQTIRTRTREKRGVVRVVVVVVVVVGWVDDGMRRKVVELDGRNTPTRRARYRDDLEPPLIDANCIHKLSSYSHRRKRCKRSEPRKPRSPQLSTTLDAEDTPARLPSPASRGFLAGTGTHFEKCRNRSSWGNLLRRTSLMSCSQVKPLLPSKRLSGTCPR
jgi:hypothetical protein